MTTTFETDNIIKEVDYTISEEELHSCQRFIVDAELEGQETKYSVTQWKNLYGTVVNKKFNRFFKNLKCVAKVNLASGFILKKIDDRRFRYI